MQVQEYACSMKLSQQFFPSCPHIYNPGRIQEKTFYFYLTPQQATDFNIRPGLKCDYGNQVQMRFCILKNSEQDDFFPLFDKVKVNNKWCPLPDPPGPPHPVNITEMVKLSPTVPNTITVSWAADYISGYAISVSLVHKLSSMDLLQRLKSKGIKDSNYTRAKIEEQLCDDEDEIATTSLRVSLMCPLGQTRMSTPCRPKTCGHLQCFDASLFLEMNERKPTWKCPVCNKPAPYDDLFIDGYFTEVLCSSLLSSECNEIQLNKDGTWCVETQEIIVDDTEIISSNIAATSSMDKSAEESHKRNIVDLSVSEDEEPASKVRASKPEIISSNIDATSSTNKSAEESCKRNIVDLSVSEDEELASKVRASKPEIIDSNIAATSSTDKPAEVPSLEESRIRDIVDLTVSDHEDEEPASKVRAIATKPGTSVPTSFSTYLPTRPLGTRLKVLYRKI